MIQRVGIVLLFFLLQVGSASNSIASRRVGEKKKLAIEKEINDLKRMNPEVYLPKRRPDKLWHLTQHPRRSGIKEFNRIKRDATAGSAAYFDGSDQLLKLRLQGRSSDVRVPQRAFTVQFWARPEGGQGKYTPIVDMFDECEKKFPNSRWTVGIRSLDHSPRDARFVFSLKTESSPSWSHLQAHKQYDHQAWTNVAASYDGTTMSIYINGAKISLGYEQRGMLFGDTSLRCKEIVVGGDDVTGDFYRGQLDELILWNRSLSHEEIVDNMNKVDLGSLVDDVDGSKVFSESFDELSQWRTRGGGIRIVQSDTRSVLHHIRFEAPPCGETVCDDPEAVLNYRNHPQLRREKVIRYRIVNVAEDNGENPTVSNQQIHDQHRAILQAYEPYNISFSLDQIVIRNTTLRQRVIIFHCSAYKVGNGECDRECQHSTTGNDGGDCDQIRSECWQGLLGNGRCDTECNKAYHNYDDGDCCLPGPQTHVTCLEPWNPLKAYVEADDLKQRLQLDGSDRLNIFLIDASWWEHQMVGGIATFPWEKHVFSSLGGNILHKSNFGNPARLTSLVHELGHNLGLWHVHHGVSELKCNDPCSETHPSMVLGDMCSDTNPTPRNTKCSDPRPDSYDKEDGACGRYVFKDTPYNNYMSYSRNGCADHFTPQQVARMHCYLDLVYQPMREMKLPSPIVAAPKVLHASPSSVNLVWMAPLGLDTSCDADKAYLQYADTAVSSHGGIQWAPHEATGPPDSEQCQPSLRSWMPNFPDTCSGNTCWLELGFRKPVIPSRISIWVADISPEITLDVELLSVGGARVALGKPRIYCDMETTINIDTDEIVDKVRIYTSDPYVGIDSVQLVSNTDHPTCSKRKLPKYKLHRDPPFSSGYVMTADTDYEDSEVKDGVTYQYRVQVVIDSRASELSPGLTYTNGAAFCGDGSIDKTQGEECDDANARDGDGCSLDCKLEESFKCIGSPSLCYKHDGDGVCEDFEKQSVEKDCGFFTPEGYSDQWVTSAVANPVFQHKECPESVLTGAPNYRMKCTGQPDNAMSWRPCGELEDSMGSFWVEAFVDKPVVATEILVHLGSDGYTPFSPEVKAIDVDLIYVNNSYAPLTFSDSMANCWENPIRFPIIQDLSQPFFLTKGVRVRFSYSSISIAAIRIRSSSYIDPITMSTCRDNELYNARLGRCEQSTCSRISCGPHPIKYGFADCTGQLEGDTCTILCDSGYTTGSQTAVSMCEQGTWTSSGLAVGSGPLACSPVECHRPYIPYATVACPDGTQFSNECHFKCDRPARLEGSDATIRCQANGRWSEQNARCQVSCDILDVEFYQKGDLKTPSCLDGPQPAGKVCKVRCKDGYHVEGEKVRRRVLRVECGTDGRWDGMTCVRNQCPPIENVFTGAYTCNDDRYSGSTCTMKCPESIDVPMAMTCGLDGTWEGSFSICPSLLTRNCKQVNPQTGLQLQCDGTTVGSKCAVTCDDDMRVPVRRQITEEGGQVRTFAEVKDVDCAMSLSWLPAPGTIACVDIMSIGDGICDAENNREFYFWDGGDCCPSTVIDGDVITIPEHCPVDCACKDPEAMENKRRRRRHKNKFKMYAFDSGNK